MRFLKRAMICAGAFLALGLSLYAGGVRADIWTCMFAYSPMQYCQSFASIPDMMMVAGTSGVYATQADCLAVCY